MALLFFLPLILGRRTSLPFLLSKLKIDPATASAPLITSMADILGILIYFSIAVAIIPIP
ncbi:magnesium transporter [Thiomicrospira sp.]|uniref:magnesium transporter n=1 Tax=Thiomicrospira sp. TaxID=935 RepID=UPI0025E240FD|nr:magnesium transporter [Thiomicrospira sp.]